MKNFFWVLLHIQKGLGWFSFSKKNFHQFGLLDLPTYFGKNGKKQSAYRGKKNTKHLWLDKMYKV